MLAKLSLPEAPRARDVDASRYVGLMYGRAGIGKTSWCASWPDCMVLSFERVSRGLSGYYDFNWENGGITSWPIMRRAVELLEASKRHPTVIVDTGDMAYRRCMEQVCRERNVEHPEDEGWGKGWNEVRKEFSSVFKRILDTGRGLWFISHSREVEITSFSGNKFSRIQPTLPGQAYEFIKGVTDLTFYAEFMTDRSGKEKRVLITLGDELIDAKNSMDLPKFIPLERRNGFKTLEQALSGETAGIAPADLIPGKKTSEAATRLVRLESSKGSAKPGAARKSVPARRK